MKIFARWKVWTAAALALLVVSFVAPEAPRFFAPQPASAQIFLSGTTVTVTRVLTTSGTAQLGDILVELNCASACNYTIPPNSSVAFPLGSWITVVEIGAGQGAAVAGSGVTIHSKSNWLKLSGQYSAASFYKRGTDEWVYIGDITAMNDNQADIPEWNAA